MATDTTAHRIARLKELARRVGGKTTLGQQLGYADGSYIGQMLSGLRPVSEKFVQKVHAKKEFAGWFDAPDDRLDASTPGGLLGLLTPEDRERIERLPRSAQYRLISHLLDGLDAMGDDNHHTGPSGKRSGS